VVEAAVVLQEKLNITVPGCRFHGLERIVQRFFCGLVHMGALADTGMIFIPCRAGLSHCPEEWAGPRDLLRGAQCLLLTLLNLDGLGHQS
jgi:hypothetical protein